MTLNRFAAAYSLILSLVVLATACARKEESSPSAPAPQPAAGAAPEHMADVTELKIEDLKVGTEAEAVTGKRVTVHYTGWLTNGTKFDSSKDYGQPFTFQLGSR